MRVLVDAKALYCIFGGVIPEEITTCKYIKKAWDILVVTIWALSQCSQNM